MKEIAKYVDSQRLAKTNQIDIVNNKKGYRLAIAGFNISKPWLSLMFSVVFAFALISLSSESVIATPDVNTVSNAEFYIQELASTKNSGRVIRERNIATASGVGRIVDDTVQARLLGRRAALLDARRNLLILKARLLKEQGIVGDGKYSVSGRIARVRIHSERVTENFYYLQVDIPLDELMEGMIEIVE